MQAGLGWVGQGSVPVWPKSALQATQVFVDVLHAPVHWPGLPALQATHWPPTQAGRAAVGQGLGLSVVTVEPKSPLQTTQLKFGAP